MTRADEVKPTRRLTSDAFGAELVVEVYARRIVIRPKGTRAGGPQEQQVSPGQLYLRLVQVDLEQKRREKARKKGKRK